MERIILRPPAERRLLRLGEGRAVGNLAEDGHHSSVGRREADVHVVEVVAAPLGYSRLGLRSEHAMISSREGVPDTM